MWPTQVLRNLELAALAAKALDIFLWPLVKVIESVDLFVYFIIL